MVEEQLLEQKWRQLQTRKFQLPVVVSTVVALGEISKDRDRRSNSSLCLAFLLWVDEGLLSQSWVHFTLPGIRKKRKSWWWGWSWRPCPGWSASGRRPCIEIPRRSPLLHQQPLSFVLPKYCRKTKRHAVVFTFFYVNWIEHEGNTLE